MDFNFGTLEMRLDPAMFGPVALTVAVAIAGGGMIVWVPLAIARLRALAQGPFVAAFLGTVIIGPPIILTPLYESQNYYPAARSPAVAMLVGLGLSQAWVHRHRFAPRVAGIVGAALWVTTFSISGAYWLDAYRPVVDRDHALPAARFIAERSEPNDWIIVTGRGWDPTPFLLR